MVGDQIIKKLAISLFTWSALAATSYAQDNSSERMNSLPIDQAYSEIVRLEGAFGESAPPVGIFYHIARFSLAQLHYPVDLRNPTAPLNDSDIIEVIRDFEERAGLEVDGMLTWGDFSRLTSLSAWNYLTKINFSGGFGVYHAPMAEMVGASGSWSMPYIGFPLNRSDIRCDLRDRICEETIVTVSSPNIAEIDTFSPFYSISSHSVSYDIDSWRNGIVEATATSSCRTSRLSINTSTDLVTLTTQDLDREGCAIPGSELRLPLIGGLRVATLIDPDEASRSYFDAVEGFVSPVRGPMFGMFSPAR